MSVCSINNYLQEIYEKTKLNFSIWHFCQVLATSTDQITHYPNEYFQFHSVFLVFNIDSLYGEID